MKQQHKTILFAVLGAVAAIAAINRSPQAKAVVYGDKKFLGIF